MEYTCPVCGYDKLEDPPSHHEICPSCGTQFGYHDFTKTHAELRAVWIAHGLRWHSKVDTPPPYWNPFEQLENIKSGFHKRLSPRKIVAEVVEKEEINIPEGYTVFERTVLPNYACAS